MSTTMSTLKILRSAQPNLEETHSFNNLSTATPPILKGSLIMQMSIWHTVTLNKLMINKSCQYVVYFCSLMLEKAYNTTSDRLSYYT